MDSIDELNGAAEALEKSFADSASLAQEFNSELKGLQRSMGDTVQDLGKLEAGFSRGLRRAFDGVLFDGMRLSEALGVLGQAMSQTVYNNAMKPVTEHFGGLLANGVQSLVSAVMPFAKGGVVNGPTAFSMGSGLGVMGEAGPEAIMPLRRGADGRLGVAADGRGPITITMNITTPDVHGFQRSEAQIAAQMARALGRGNRNR